MNSDLVMGFTVNDGIRIGSAVAHKDNPSLKAIVVGLTPTEVTILDDLGDRYTISRAKVVPAER